MRMKSTQRNMNAICLHSVGMRLSVEKAYPKTMHSVRNASLGRIAFLRNAVRGFTSRIPLGMRLSVEIMNKDEAYISKFDGEIFKGR